MWFYPDGSRILELSTKCAPAEAFQVAAETRAYLLGRGVDLAGEQQTKTRTALEFFAQSRRRCKRWKKQSYDNYLSRPGHHREPMATPSRGS